MTLILAAIAKETIWLAADRRLSIQGRAPKDDACKVMFVETSDGVAILGYAGLGATAAGMEPSEWMSNCLRGRKLTLEQSLSVLAKAIESRMPRHLLDFPMNLTAHHAVVAPAFVVNEPRLYMLQLKLSPDRKQKRMHFVRHMPWGGRKPPRFALAGSGAIVLVKNKEWIRPLTRIIRAADRKQLALHLVPKYFAQINNNIQAVDAYVSSRCIVAWRNRKKGVHKGGGAQAFFTGTTRENEGMIIPTIGNGMDIREPLNSRVGGRRQ